jgi:hypothetical protein
MQRILISGLMVWALSDVQAEDVQVDLRLPASAGISTSASGTRWRDLPVVGTDLRRDVLVMVADQRVAIARALVAADDGEAAAALPGLLARATAAGISPATLRLERGLLTGIHLRGEEVLVLPEVVLRQRVGDPVRASDLLTAVTTAGEQVTTELPSSELSPAGRQAVARALALLSQNQLGEDECAPALLRQLVASGWLDQHLAELPSWPRLRQALDEARRLQPHQRWFGDEHDLTEYSDAFARRVFVLRTPQGTTRLQAHPSGSSGGAPRLVMYRYAAGVDALSAGMPDAAEVWWGRQRLLRWSPTTWDVDTARWRQALPDDGPGTGDDTLIDWRPPHVVVSDAEERVLALLTKQGVLRPASGEPADGERFLNDAVRILPDAQHLDLIGQYLFSYVHDSPDPLRPWLIGMRGSTGEIHQTVAQTIATVSGGVMRGDCDDLSELYQDLLTRQGHLPQVFNLPRHAACGWTLRQGDQWTTQILHTGQPLAFHANTVSGSVAQAFEHFRDAGSESGTQVNLLLRFAGENTRARYSLDSRILHDAPYARTMIAVQRDWHFHTYAAGIRAMRGLIAAGDDAAANWGELAGLYRRTGQWDAAIACQHQAIERTREPVARFQARLTWLRLHAFADHHALVAKQLAEVLSELDRTYVGTAHERDRRLALNQVLDLLDREAHRSQRYELIEQRLLPPLEKSLTELLPWVRTRFDRRTWDTRWREVREQAGRLIGIILVEARRRGGAELARDPSLQRQVAFAERWLSGLSLLPGGERTEIMQAYASLGYLGQTMLGDVVFAQVLQHASEPLVWSDDHQRSGNGLAQLLRDAGWIRLSVPFWKGRLLTLMRDSEPTNVLSSDAVLETTAGLQAAIRGSEHLQIVAPLYERDALHARLIAALISTDANALDQVLRDAAERRDRQTDTLVTDTVVSMAPHLGTAWFRQVLARWKTLAATKPGYFAIAWGCATAGHVAQALEAGALAAATHADDPAFVAEFRYLQQVLAGGGEP